MFAKYFEENPGAQKKMFFITAGTIVLLGLLLLVASVAIGKAAGLWGGGYYPERTIVVKGYGEVDAVPDVAVFTFDIREEADTTEEAQKVAADKVNEIIDMLLQEGVVEEDIKTLSYSANPQYDWLPPVDCATKRCGNVQTLRNYVVSQSTRVKVQESEKAGILLGKIGSSGVNYVSGLSFTFDDDTDLEEEALALAIKNAKEKAKDRAKLMEARLGKIIDFYDLGEGGYPVEPYYGAALESADMFVKSASFAEPTISQGESTISKQIEVVFEIK